MHARAKRILSSSSYRLASKCVCALILDCKLEKPERCRVKPTTRPCMLAPRGACVSSRPSSCVPKVALRDLNILAPSRSSRRLLPRLRIWRRIGSGSVHTQRRRQQPSRTRQSSSTRPRQSRRGLSTSFLRPRRRQVAPVSSSIKRYVVKDARTF